MMNTVNEIKFQTCNIGDAMLRNINNNFLSISFNLENGDVQVKIIMEEKTIIEENYIDDFVTELAALQNSNCIKKPIIELGNNKKLLNNNNQSKK